MAEIRIKGALRHSAPRAANQSYQPENQALVWRERFVSHRHEEWVGTLIVLEVDAEKKLVYV